MQIDLEPKKLVEVAGISPSHASNILNGKRGASAEIALAAFRATGVRLGLLAQMSDEDIAKLCEQQKDGSCVHPATDTLDGDSVQSGKSQGVTAQDQHAVSDGASISPPSATEAGGASCLTREGGDA